MIGTEIQTTLQQPDLLSVLGITIPFVIISLFLWNVERILCQPKIINTH